MLRIQARRQTAKDGCGAFTIFVPEDDFDSVTKRRARVVTYIVKTLKPLSEAKLQRVINPFPTQLIGLCGCSLMYNTPDDLPIDDVSCRHGKLLGFVAQDPKVQNIPKT